MKKIAIHNFGPIKDAVIDIKPMLVLIGPQASGKSTIAKLIYFYKTIRDIFVFKMSKELDCNINYVKEIVKSSFLIFFGVTKNFRIVYIFEDDINLTIHSKDEGILIDFSDSFFSNEIDKIKILRDSISSNNSRHLQLEMESLYDDFQFEVNKLFRTEQNDVRFTVAGRNATVGYSYSFEDSFKHSLFQKKINTNTTDEVLMKRFLTHVTEIKDIFVKYGNFQDMISSAKNDIEKSKLTLAYQLIKKVLIGEYHISDMGETISHNGDFVYLNNASSGQQEAIRILQDAFWCIYKDENIFRVVEEPEAHLYPEAQKATIELLTLALNNKEGNNLIITTHSPYTLTVINNLIFAAKVGKDNPDKVKNIISEELWLPTKRVAAYILKDGTAESIIDDELGEIKAELIDEVSHTINEEYDKIYNIEYETATN